MERDTEVDSEAEEETVDTVSTFLSDKNMLVHDEDEETIAFSPNVARSTMNTLIHKIQTLRGKLIMDYEHTSAHWDPRKHQNTHIIPGQDIVGLQCPSCASVMTQRIGCKNAPKQKGSKPPVYTGPAATKMQCNAAKLARMEGSTDRCSECVVCRFVLEHVVPEGSCMPDCGCMDCNCLGDPRVHKLQFDVANRFDSTIALHELSLSVIIYQLMTINNYTIFVIRNDLDQNQGVPHYSSSEMLVLGAWCEGDAAAYLVIHWALPHQCSNRADAHVHRRKHMEGTKGDVRAAEPSAARTLTNRRVAVPSLPHVVVPYALIETH